MNTIRLPLFPLPLVLFPGTSIPLHIFEQRYREMVRDVLSGDRRFGILYHDPDEHGPFLNERGRVGTVAEVTRHQPLPDGRSMILVKGLRRFRIAREETGKAAYYQAWVGGYRDRAPEAPELLLARRRRSLALFRTVLQTFPHVPEALPTFRLKRELSFRLAAVVRMDPFWQQELLELRDEMERLTRLDPVFRAGMKRWIRERRPDT